MILLYGYILLWIINIFFALSNKHSKIVIFLTWCLLFAVFAGSDGQTGDALKYKADYELGVFGSNWTEIGYSTLSNLCKFAGLTQYNKFLVVLFLLGSILAYIGIKKMNANFHVLFATTMGFIFPSLATAIRYFMAVALFIFALPYLIDRTIIFVLISLVAISFHKSAIFMLLFPIGALILSSKPKLTIRKVLLYIFVILTTFITVYVYIYRMFPFQNLLFTALKFTGIPTTKINAYFTSMTRYGWILLVFIYLMNITFFFITQNVYNRTCNIQIRKALMTALLVNVLSLVFLPFARFNLVFFRMLIYPTITNAVLLGTILSYKPNNYNSINGIPIKIAFLVVLFAWILLSIFNVNSISMYNSVISTIWVK